MLASVALRELKLMTIREQAQNLIS
jgi:hypothetical protein